MAARLLRPEPVTKAGTIAGAVAGLLITLGGLARALGWLSDDVDVVAVATQASDLIMGAAALWVVLAPHLLALWARTKVTPIADPRDDDGTPLVRDEHQPDPPPPVRHDGRPILDLPPPSDPTPTTLIPTVRRAAPPEHLEPTPIEAATAAALTATQPAIPAIRS